MRAEQPIRRLNRYYKRNPGFRQWVEANEQWFRQHPEVFEQLMEDPHMVNLFVDMLTLNAGKIKRKLNGSGGNQSEGNETGGTQ